MARRLSAILAADVVGYSRLMEMDEAGTLVALKVHRGEFIDPLIAEHGGRIVKLMGDGALVEFPSVVDAVECAVAVQQGMANRNSGTAEDRRIDFRIGVNLGDIIIEGDDIYGDGVNIAARLEALAEPGGICVSGTVHEHIAGKHGHAFIDDGEQTVKNMSRPVRVWRWSEGPSSVTPAPSAGTVLPLPDKPSVAVLPFDNMSGDPEQEYFSDGITEDIITALSKITDLFVVARNSTFTYKGQAVDVRRVGREQGVRYVLEGSVRRSGSRLRITSQLIDATTGNHLWAERYDRTLDDIFALQDEITREVTIAIQVKLTDGEQARIAAAGTKKFDAWEFTVKGRRLMVNAVRADNELARELLQEAVRLDPTYASAWCALGWVCWSDARHHWIRPREESLAMAWERAERAHEIAPESAEPLALFAMIALLQGNFSDAEAFADRALEQAGSEADVIANAAMVLSHCGRPIDAIRLIEGALRLCPFCPNYYRVVLGRACLLAGELKRAIIMLRAWQENDPEPTEPVLLATALYDDGQRPAAEELLREAVNAKLSFTIGRWAKKQSFSNPDDLAHMVSVLEEFGVPK
jgi:adenylate cyclase